MGLGTLDLNWTGIGNEWIWQRLEMGNNRSVSRLIRQVNDNPEIIRLCSKLLRMLPCEDSATLPQCHPRELRRCPPRARHLRPKIPG